MLQGIKDAWLKMPAIPGGRRVPDRSEMFAPGVFIMVEFGFEAGLSPTLPGANKSEEDASCVSTKK
jgi:hypothetical protein